MAVLESIKNLFAPASFARSEIVVPAPETAYEIRILSSDHLQEVLSLNLRCFANGDNYTKHTFEYLLSQPNTLSYRVATPSNQTVAFVFVMVNENNAAHLTTIGVAPEHRRRKIAVRLLEHVEKSLRNRQIGTLMLEVRVSNTSAQKLYRENGYTIVQRISKYYNNGEDCFLMMKPIC